MLERLTVPTQSIFIGAFVLITLNGIWTLWKLGRHGCTVALSYFGLGIIYYFLTIMAAIAGAFCFGTLGVNMFAVSIFVLLQVVGVFLWTMHFTQRQCKS
jgi:hypothetical protein